MKNRVMVPVPEELADDVEKFLLETDMRSIAASRSDDIDPDAVVDLVQRLNERSRLAFTALADGVLLNERTSMGEIARVLHWTNYETVGVIQELQEMVWQAFGPKIAIVSAGGPKDGSATVDWDQRQVIMWKDLAVAVQAAEAQLATEA